MKEVKEHSVEIVSVCLLARGSVADKWDIGGLKQSNSIEAGRASPVSSCDLDLYVLLENRSTPKRVPLIEFECLFREH